MKFGPSSRATVEMVRLADQAVTCVQAKKKCSREQARAYIRSQVLVHFSPHPTDTDSACAMPMCTPEATGLERMLRDEIERHAEQDSASQEAEAQSARTLSPCDRPIASALIDHASKLKRSYSPLAASLRRLWKSAEEADNVGFGQESIVKVGQSVLDRIRRLTVASGGDDIDHRDASAGKDYTPAGKRSGSEGIFESDVSIRERRRQRWLNSAMHGARAVRSALRSYWKSVRAAVATPSESIQEEARGDTDGLPSLVEIHAAVDALFRLPLHANAHPAVRQSISETSAFQARKCSPPASFASLFAALCSRMRGPRGMSALWCAVMKEVRWYYDRKEPLPFLPGGRAGDLGPGIIGPLPSASDLSESFPPTPTAAACCPLQGPIYCSNEREKCVAFGSEGLPSVADSILY